MQRKIESCPTTGRLFFCAWVALFCLPAFGRLSGGSFFAPKTLWAKAEKVVEHAPK